MYYNTNSLEIVYNFLVMMTMRKYLFPFRTQKSSLSVPKILAGYPAGKIGCCQIYIFLFSSVGRALGC